MSELSQAWVADWACSIPIILFTVLFHAMGLVFVEEVAVNRLERILLGQIFRIRFAVIVSTAGLLVTVLHGVEAAIWAAIFRMLGALPDEKGAMLYSLNAITAFGHANLYLKPQWELMGALEALNGLMLFGLTTAFLFSVVQGISLKRRRSKKAFVEGPPQGLGKRSLSDAANDSAAAARREQRETV